MRRLVRPLMLIYVIGAGVVYITLSPNPSVGQVGALVAALIWPLALLMNLPVFGG